MLAALSFFTRVKNERPSVKFGERTFFIPMTAGRKNFSAAKFSALLNCLYKLFHVEHFRLNPCDKPRREFFSAKIVTCRSFRTIRVRSRGFWCIIVETLRFVVKILIFARNDPTF